MNGSYDNILTFIDKNQINKIESYFFENIDEFKYRIKNFYDKYSDIFINDIINQIKSCDILNVYSKKEWVFEYKFLAADIKIIDPNNPERSLLVIDRFFKKCFNVIGASYKSFDLVSQVENGVIVNIIIDNPYLENFDLKMNSIIDESMKD